MAKKRKTVGFEENSCKIMEGMAGTLGVSLSEVVRQVVETGIKHSLKTSLVPVSDNAVVVDSYDRHSSDYDSSNVAPQVNNNCQVNNYILMNKR